MTESKIWYYDENAWANALDYPSRSLDLAKPVFDSLRGLRTIKEEFDKVASHTEHHLRQIRTALSL